jgi:hypothetical protein
VRHELQGARPITGDTLDHLAAATVGTALESTGNLVTEMWQLDVSPGNDPLHLPACSMQGGQILQQAIGLGQPVESAKILKGVGQLSAHDPRIGARV